MKGIDIMKKALGNQTPFEVGVAIKTGIEVGLIRVVRDAVYTNPNWKPTPR